MARRFDRSLCLLKRSPTYYILLAICITLPLLGAIQFSYSLAIKGETEGIVTYVESSFADHKTIANPYHIAQTISNLEALGSLRCSRLFQILPNKKDFLYLDLRYKYDCKSSPLYLNGQWFDVRFSSANGDTWKLEGFITTRPFTQVVFWVFRILAIILTGAACLILKFNAKQKNLTHQNELNIQRFKHQKYIDIARTTQNISHDLKGPIGVMAKVLEASSWAEIQETMPAYKSSLFRLQTMVSSLKDADVDALIRDSWTRFSLSKVIEELQTLYGKASISLTENLSGRIKIDVSKAERSVSNLVINAIEAGAKNIECSATIVSDSLVISVSDDGPGVPDHIKPKMFERGFTFGKASGSGLGLSFALTTARGHGGDISYTRDNGRSFFTMTLPNVVSQQDAAATEIDGSQPAIPQNWEHRPKAKKLVLVCLNDPARQQAITEGLHQDQITNDISVMNSCLFVFTDDLTLVEQCLQIEKPIFFDSSSSVEAAVHKIQNELQKA